MAKGKGKKKQGKKKGKHKKVKKMDVESLEIKNPNAGGIDLGSEEHYVAIPQGRDDESVKKFDCFTDDLHRMGKWLVNCGIETVAVEATGVYWVPVVEVLEGHYQLEVYLVHPNHCKNVPGRKTDVLDCQWIQTLHSYGLLPNSFRPDDNICRLRKYWRHRDRLVKDVSRHILRIQKELDEMNLHLHKVISDITGKTGMTIIRAILAGERDPLTLAKMKDTRIKSSVDEITRALTGNYRPEHVYALQDVVESYDHFQKQIEQLDERIEEEMRLFESKVDPEEKPLPKVKETSRKKYGNEPKFDIRTELYRMLGVDLTIQKGFAPNTIMTLVCECGIDMSHWETEKKFTSWLSLSPGSKITGGKRLSGKTRINPNKAAVALRLAAYGLQNADSELGAFLRRLKARIGPAKAITATARKLAIIYYQAVKFGEIYQDRGADFYMQQYRERTVKFLKKKAKQNQCLVLDLETLTLSDLETVMLNTETAIRNIHEKRAENGTEIPQGSQNISTGVQTT